MGHHLFRSFLLRITLTVLAAACGGLVPNALAPDTILVNGKIVTVDADFSIAEAVAPGRRKQVTNIRRPQMRG